MVGGELLEETPPDYSLFVIKYVDIIKFVRSRTILAAIPFLRRKDKCRCVSISVGALISAVQHSLGNRVRKLL